MVCSKDSGIEKYKNGYEVLVVWESDYRKNKEKVIEQCLNYLKQ